MRVRIIKSETCNQCRVYMKRLQKNNFQFETLDGDDPKFKEQLDAWKIDKYPVVQIIDKDDNVLWQFPSGTFSIFTINSKIKEMQK